MIRPLFDSRDLSFHLYGQVTPLTVFPDTFNTDRPDLLDDVQPIGDVRCMSYGICDVAEDYKGIEYDIQELISRVPVNPRGTEPKIILKEAITNGIKRKDSDIVDKIFSSYFTAHTGNQDAFDNVRSALMLTKYPILVWGPWYSNWQGGIAFIGNYFNSYHCTDIEGWGKLSLISQDGAIYLSIEAWTGRKFLFSREVFNWWTSKPGFGSAVLSTIEIDKVRVKTVLESIIDTLKNLVIYYNVLISQKKKMNKTEQLYTVAQSFLGRDASPRDRADDEYGCADSVNCVFKEAFGEEIGGTVSTYMMYQVLKDSRRFKKVTEWKRGCIIISPSNYGNGRIVGHVGIVSDDDKIMSNTSSDGIWRENFTILTWIKRYRDIGELPIMFFETL